MLRRLTGNTLILIFNNVGGAALAFIISAIIGRELGAEGLGQYSFIMAWITPLVALADFGMGSLITRDIAQNRDAALPTLQTATRALVPIAGLMFFIALLLIPSMQLSPTITLSLALVSLLIILDPWYGLYTALFRAFQQMWPILIVNVGGLGLQLALTFAAIRGGTGLIGVAAIVAAINVLQLIITWALWRKYRPALEMNSNIKSSLGVREILKRAWPFALAAVLGALQLRLNVLLLERLSGDVAVGLYSAASRFVEAGRLFPSALFGALFPALASLAAQPEAMRRTFLRAAALLAIFAAAFGMAMFLFGGLLIHLAYESRGATFAGAVPVLTLLSWSLVPSLLRGVTTLYLYGLGKEQIANVITIAALIVQAILGWLLIERWGAPGAAVTVILVEGGIALCLWFALGGLSLRRG